MFFPVALFVFWLTTDSLATPLPKSALRFPIRRSQSTLKLSRQVALAARAATRHKFQNAAALLAGLGTSPGYTVSSSLQNAYTHASDYATNVTLLSSLSPVVTAAAPLSNGTIDPLQDETDGVDDYEYYGPMAFGSQAQSLMIDFDTGSADIWVTVDCKDCGALLPFRANASSTFHNTTQPFSVVYGVGSVSGTLARDTVSVGPLVVHNQTFGAVRSVSPNFATSPNDGLTGLAFGTIANSRQPTFFENAMAYLQAPLFSVYLTRTQVRGSEIYFGGIDASKASDTDVRWVPVVSKTYWTVNMAAVSVNDARVDTGNVQAIVDTGTSFIYLPSHIANATYKLIPGAKPAPDYGTGFWSYPCAAPVAVSFELGRETLALDARDFNLGRHEGDSTNSTCIAALVDAGSRFNFAILGDSFLKGFVSIYDYSHDGRVGFVKSINERE